MTAADRSRLFAASLSVLALAAGMAGGAARAQTLPSGEPVRRIAPQDQLPPAVILAPEQSPDEAAPGQTEPGQTAPGEDAPDEASPDDEETPPTVTLAEEPAEPAIPEVWAPVPTDAEGRSAYGLYLAGKLALMQGQGGAGADFLARAQALTPEQPRVKAQAFTSALLSGDLDQAARIAPAPGEAPAVMVEGGRLVRIVQTFAHGDARAADAALAREPIAAPHARAGLMVSPWIAAAAGDWDRALQAPPTAADPLTLAFARLNQAQLLEHRRRYDEAEAALKGLSDTAVIGALFHRPYGEFLERRGRRDEALAVYRKAIEGGTVDLALVRALTRARDGGRAPAMPTFRQGAAEALANAAAQASAERGHEFAAVYLRLSLNLDDTPASQLALGQTLDRAGLSAASRTAYSLVGTQDPVLYATARAQLAAGLQEEGRPEDALAELRRAAEAAPDDARVALMLAGQLMTAEKNAEALEILNGPLLNREGQTAQVHFLRGAAYEALERVPEAEAELWAAVQAAPEDADMLNYLGYLWVDRDLRVQQGAEMIQRALALEPENGNIQDSLGWAQYRQGDYSAAVDSLEQAIDKEPANAEINDHLGDAYWRVGRRREAEWMWKRVLVLEPDDARRAEVERKIEQGLDDGAATGGVSQ
ncbi:tetratricopeptide repeat protein [Brevundimonas albigilva]|uniref:tetratricopeptide repeat protein n=1 Tax=Brevundimonas albigilva TaxID=1312364 RepID=UPI0024BFE47F|nr:tetratricopeptide repeat protein [Brevundimonas albigilva]